MADIGIVETKILNVKESLKLECGRELPEFDIAYETYGELNKKKDNAILVLHALTADAHAAGKNSPEDKKFGWWNDMIGPDKAFDTNKFFVISSNCLGGCKGTTGPSSINPETNKPYGLDFPVITVEDMVNVQKKLIDFLGIEKLTVVGGSMGGMQALEWACSYPDIVQNAIIIASTSRLSAQAIGFNAVGRNAIISDVNFNNGDYYDKKLPEKGLGIARMVGHITYLCEEAMHNKFGRDFKSKPSFDFGVDFEVESYLDYQGRIFVDRFDANSYLYITKAIDYYDLPKKFGGSLVEAFKHSNARFLIISFSSDWLFTTEQSKEMVHALLRAQKNVSFMEIPSSCGHDAFLIEYEDQTKAIKSFLGDL